MKHRAHGQSGSTPESGAHHDAGADAPRDERSRRDTGAVLLLGLNAWGVALVWPLLAAGEDAAAVARWPLLASLSPLLLGAGLRLWQPARASLRDALPAALWLGAYPAALALAFASRPESLHQDAFGTLALVLLWAALCAYVAGALSACREQTTQLAAQHADLDEGPWDAPADARSRLQPFAIGLCVAGALAIALLAPTLGGASELTAAWGGAAREGGMLTSVAGAALGTAVLAVFLGGALRAEVAPRVAPGDARMRAGFYLFLALLSLLTYGVVQP